MDRKPRLCNFRMPPRRGLDIWRSAEERGGIKSVVEVFSMCSSPMERFRCARVMMAYDQGAIGFMSMANHKFLWRSDDQILRKRRPNNFKIFVRVRAAMTIEEISAFRSLFGLFHQPYRDQLPVKIGKSFNFRRGEALEDGRSCGGAPRITASDDFVTFYCGTPLMESFARMDAIMEGIGGVGLTCGAEIDIGDGDIFYYAIWKPKEEPPIFTSNIAVGGPAYYRLKSPRPLTERKIELSIKRAARIAALAGRIEQAQ